MPKKCAIFGCPYTKGHRFPKNPGTRDKWMEALRHSGLPSNVDRYVVCYRHFVPSDYTDHVALKTRKRLKFLACPSVFLDVGSDNEAVLKPQKTYGSGKKATPVEVIEIKPEPVSSDEAEETSEEFSEDLTNETFDIPVEEVIVKQEPDDNFCQSEDPLAIPEDVLAMPWVKKIEINPTKKVQERPPVTWEVTGNSKVEEKANKSEAEKANKIENKANKMEENKANREEEQEEANRKEEQKASGNEEQTLNEKPKDRPDQPPIPPKLVFFRNSAGNSTNFEINRTPTLPTIQRSKLSFIQKNKPSILQKAKLPMVRVLPTAGSPQSSNVVQRLSTPDGGSVLVMKKTFSFPIKKTLKIVKEKNRVDHFTLKDMKNSYYATNYYKLATHCMNNLRHNLGTRIRMLEDEVAALQRKVDHCETFHRNSPQPLRFLEKTRVEEKAEEEVKEVKDVKQVKKVGEVDEILEVEEEKAEQKKPIRQLKKTDCASCGRIPKRKANDDDDENETPSKRRTLKLETPRPDAIAYSSAGKSMFTGSYRIVELEYFVNAICNMHYHHFADCPKSKIVIDSETLSGTAGEWTLKCIKCCYSRVILTDPASCTKLWNHWLTWMVNLPPDQLRDVQGCFDQLGVPFFYEITPTALKVLAAKRQIIPLAVQKVLPEVLPVQRRVQRVQRPPAPVVLREKSKRIRKPKCFDFD